jgi:putrescine transport system permease protein
MAQTAENHQNPARWLIVAIPYLWLAFFFLVPFFIVLKISLSDHRDLDAALCRRSVQGLRRDLGDFFSQLDFENYTFLASDSLYITAYLNSLRIALISTCSCSSSAIRSRSPWRARRPHCGRCWSCW